MAESAAVSKDVPMPEAAPDFLITAFPGHHWQTVRSCELRVDGDGSAGLELEASDFGYVVDSVDSSPGQAPELRAGAAIAAIDGVSLLGLEEEALEAAFGAKFRAGAQLTLVDVVELREAGRVEISSQACTDVVMEHGSVVRVALNASVMQAMSSETRDSFDQDLSEFSKRQGVRAELHCPEGSVQAVVLSGVPEEVQSSRAELGALLDYYGLAAAADGHKVATTSQLDPDETVEVEGLVMQSLPARNRRRRKAPGDPESETVLEADVAAGEAEGADATTNSADAKMGTAESQASETLEVRQYEYLDHTADVILHSWGKTLKEAFAQVCVCFFSYMTELDTVDLVSSVEVEATGHDMLDLLYHLLDEFLFSFGTEFIVCRRIEILELDQVALRVRAQGRGERFNLKKHPQGTEIKAITMHQMKILTEETLTTEEGTVPRKQSAMEGGTTKDGFPYECYVLVDI